LQKFVIASNNKKKIKELSRILNPMGICAVTVAEAGFEPVEVEENGKTFAENAYIKAKAISDYTSMPAIADDSGLCVDALDGQPGVYTARYGGEGLNDVQRYELLLENLKDIPDGHRGAKFVSAICCVFPDGRSVAAEGECKGSIAHSPVGENGFGYDPVFVYEDGRGFAEISDSEKDAISHRGRALKIFSEKLKSEVQ